MLLIIIASPAATLAKRPAYAAGVRLSRRKLELVPDQPPIGSLFPAKFGVRACFKRPATRLRSLHGTGTLPPDGGGEGGADLGGSRRVI